jgi:hypothetical protein
MNKQAKDPASFGEHYTSAETLLLNRIATRARARNTSSFFQDEESDDWDERMKSSASSPSSRRIQIIETADGKRFLIAAPYGQKPQLADGTTPFTVSLFCLPCSLLCFMTLLLTRFLQAELAM